MRHDQDEPDRSPAGGMSGRRRTIRALIWSSAGTGVAFASNILAMIWLSRVLGPRIVGTSAAVLAICNIFRATLLLPIVQATVTEQGQTAAFARAAGRLSTAVGLGGFAALAAGGYGASLTLDAPFLAQLSAVAGASVAVAAAGGRSFAVLQRALRFRTLSIFQACGAALGSLVAAPVVAYSSFSALALVVGALVAASVECLGAMWASRGARSRSDTGDGTSVATVARASSGLVAVGFSSSVALQGDTLVVAATLGPGPAGLYSRAYRLMALPANLLGDVADAVLLSAGAQATLQRLRRAFESASLLILILTWPIGLVCAVLAEDLVRVLLGEEWMGSVPVLRVLCLALPFRVAYKGPAIILKSRRRSWALTQRLAVYAALVVTLASAGAGLGLVWVGVGVAASVMTFYVLISVAVSNELAVPLRVWSDNALAAALALPGALTALVVSQATQPWHAWARLATCGALSVGVLAVTWFLVWRSSAGRLSDVRAWWSEQSALGDRVQPTAESATVESAPG